jgi:hypothetical protein
MRGRSRQIVRGYPYRRLSRSAITFSHCHATECTMPALFWQNNRGYFPLSTNQPDRLSPRPARAAPSLARRPIWVNAFRRPYLGRSS